MQHCCCVVDCAHPMHCTVSRQSLCVSFPVGSFALSVAMATVCTTHCFPCSEINHIRIGSRFLLSYLVSPGSANAIDHASTCSCAAGTCLLGRRRRQGTNEHRPYMYVQPDLDTVKAA
jgi:hypothetical protein